MTRKWEATFASKGKRCSNRSQKAWMVWIFKPPGVSTVRAKRRRAKARSVNAKGAPVLRISLSSASSSSVVHFDNVSKTRRDIFAAAALVKVRQRIFDGGVPASSRRITRWVSTWVLPEPALAETHAVTPGSAARVCAASVSGGMA